MKTQISKPVREKAVYAAEYKEEALKWWRASGRSAAQIGNELGIRAALLYRWARTSASEYAGRIHHVMAREDGREMIIEDDGCSGGVCASPFIRLLAVIGIVFLAMSQANGQGTKPSMKPKLVAIAYISTSDGAMRLIIQILQPEKIKVRFSGSITYDVIVDRAVANFAQEKLKKSHELKSKWIKYYDLSE